MHAANVRTLLWTGWHASQDCLTISVRGSLAFSPLLLSHSRHCAALRRGTVLLPTVPSLSDDGLGFSRTTSCFLPTSAGFTDAFSQTCMTVFFT